MACGGSFDLVQPTWDLGHFGPNMGFVFYSWILSESDFTFFSSVLCCCFFLSFFFHFNKKSKSKCKIPYFFDIYRRFLRHVFLIMYILSPHTRNQVKMKNPIFSANPIFREVRGYVSADPNCTPSRESKHARLRLLCA